VTLMTQNPLIVGHWLAHPIYCEDTVPTASRKIRSFSFDQSAPNQIYTIHRHNVLLKKSASQILRLYYNLKEEVQSKKHEGKVRE
jgi:hypothetical protein